MFTLIYQLFAAVPGTGLQTWKSVLLRPLGVKSTDSDIFCAAAWTAPVGRE